MKEQLYKNATLSFLIINFWTLYGFFEYFTEQGMFVAFGVLEFYIYSIIVGIGIGIILILLRLFIFKKDKKTKLKYNFFYLFLGIFNLNLFIIWIILIILKIFVFNLSVYFILGNCIISAFIFSDIFGIIVKIKSYKSLSKNK